jgi:hypothetical protein
VQIETFGSYWLANPPRRPETMDHPKSRYQNQTSYGRSEPKSQCDQEGRKAKHAEFAGGERLCTSDCRVGMATRVRKGSKQELADERVAQEKTLIDCSRNDESALMLKSILLVDRCTSVIWFPLW